MSMTQLYHDTLTKDSKQIDSLVVEDPLVSLGPKFVIMVDI